MEALIWIFVAIAVIGGTLGAIVAGVAAFIISRKRPTRRRVYVTAGAALAGAMTGAVAPVWYQICSSGC